VQIRGPIIYRRQCVHSGTDSDSATLPGTWPSSWYRTIGPFNSLKRVLQISLKTSTFHKLLGHRIGLEMSTLFDVNIHTFAAEILCVYHKCHPDPSRVFMGVSVYIHPPTHTHTILPL
jgi:hypothetical protein